MLPAIGHRVHLDTDTSWVVVLGYIGLAPIRLYVRLCWPAHIYIYSSHLCRAPVISDNFCVEIVER